MRLHLFAPLLMLLAAPTAHASSYQQRDGTIVDPIQLRDAAGPATYSGPNLEPFADLSGIQVSFASLRNADLRGADLSDASLDDADLIDADLSNAIMTDISLGDAELNSAILVGADMSGAFMLFAGLSFADMTGVNLAGADLESARLEFTNLTGANLTGVGTGLVGQDGANFSNTIFRNATLSNMHFGFSPLDGADMRGAILTNAHLDGVSGSAFYDASTDFSGSGFDPVLAGWTFVPEPNSALLLSLGLALLSNRRRSRPGHLLRREPPFPQPSLARASPEG